MTAHLAPLSLLVLLLPSLVVASPHVIVRETSSFYSGEVGTLECEISLVNGSGLRAVEVRVESGEQPVEVALTPQSSVDGTRLLTAKKDPGGEGWICALVFPSESAQLDAAESNIVAELSCRAASDDSKPFVSVRAISQDGALIELPVTYSTLAVPSEMSLVLVPNPSVDGFEIRFQLAQRTSVELAIFDPAGRRVRTVVDGDHDAGSFVERWDGKDESGSRVPAGTYFSRLLTDTGDVTSRAVVLNNGRR